VIKLKNAPMEVKVINKQKFLAELGRLLTFMYEEDRQTALAMYSEMFDDAVEEQSLLQFLVSPTRQAVVLARSYDAQERKLQVHTQSREGNYDYNGQVPQFVLTIDDLRQKAAAAGLFAPAEEAPAQDENQFSLFDEAAQSSEAAQPQPPVYAAPAAEPVVEEAPAAEPVVEEAAEDAAEQPSGNVDEFADAVNAFLEDLQKRRSAEPVDDDDSDLVLPVRVTVKKAEAESPMELSLDNDDVPADSAVEASDAPVDSETESPSPAVEEADSAEEDTVGLELTDSPLDLSEEKEAHKVFVKDLHKHPKAEAESAELSEPVPDTVTVKPVAKNVSKKGDGLDSIDSDSLGDAAKPRKANVPLLILFIILAIIPTLIGVALLLIPTALCLGLAVAFVSGGVLVLTAAFGGFAIFADLMIVLGLAIILLAFGLLFTWMFIWFIGGAIVGFIRWVCHLGGKLCFKEVAAQ
jgi:hypothetical protein